MSKLLLFSSLLLIIASILTGCNGYLSTYESPQQINEPILISTATLLDVQTERINNCDGANSSYTVRYKNAETQNASFKVVVGAGNLVAGDPIPPVLQSQLEAKVNASLSKQYGILVEANQELRLESPPGTNIQNTITWKATKVTGYLDIIYSNGSARVEFSKIANVELHDRQSTALGCANVTTATPTVVFATDPTQIALGTPGQLCDDYSYDPATIDVTILDGTQMTPGQDFVKTWKIKNTGICPWGDGYSLIYAGYADKMSGEPMPLGTVVAIGEEVNVSVNFKAPTDIGKYTGAWQMANAKGVPFGKALLVKIVVKAGEVGTSTPETTSDPTQTPNPTQTLQAAFSNIDSQFKNLLKGNIAFNRPEQMKKDETTSVELILSPSLSQPVLATQLVDQGGFVTSTADPNLLLSPSGGNVSIETSQIEITQRMKAVLLPRDSEAFAVTAMHDNAEQVVSSVETTAWRWSVTAKKEGSQTLELVIYQLVKYDGKEFWHEVETYKANIVVEVTLGDRVKSLDWKWIAGFIIALIGSVLGILKWLDELKKKAAENKPSAPVRRKK